MDGIVSVSKFGWTCWELPVFYLWHQRHIDSFGCNTVTQTREYETHTRNTHIRDADIVTCYKTDIKSFHSAHFFHFLKIKPCCFSYLFQTVSSITQGIIFSWNLRWLVSLCFVNNNKNVWISRSAGVSLFTGLTPVCKPRSQS